MTASAEYDSPGLSERLRIRSPEQLAMQNRGLVELSRILQHKDVPHYLSSGTLLGAVREGNFIPWDWDVQFYFRLEDVERRFDELLSAIEAEGFVAKREKLRSDPANWKIVVKKYDTDYEMTAWRLRGAQRIRSTWKLPARFFENPETIRFLERDYICMTPPQEYLVFCYGDDWRTPKRIDNKDDYLAASFYRVPKCWLWSKAEIRKVLSFGKRLLIGKSSDRP